MTSWSLKLGYTYLYQTFKRDENLARLEDPNRFALLKSLFPPKDVWVSPLKPIISRSTQHLVATVGLADAGRANDHRRYI